MNFLTYFKEKAKKFERIIGIGLSNDIEITENIIQIAKKIVKSTKNEVLLVGDHSTIDVIKKKKQKLNKNIKFIASSEPANFLAHQLFQEHSLDAIIRGGLSSSEFIKKIKNFGKYEKINRLALLETNTGKQFFFAGVGIDEINNFEQKFELMQNSIVFLNKIGITPKIGILSGGRNSDLGRDSWIDENIKSSIRLEEKLIELYPNITIKHYQILIEAAISDNVNLILAPEGIAGNLIYRTLVHLGGGRSYGAIYLKSYNNNKIIIDCSRIAPKFEIEGAFYFALGVQSE
nr:phosphate butyryltransferase [Candidatus Prometheoarchaeum syntrophicum]